MENRRRKSRAALLATVVFVLLVAAVVGVTVLRKSFLAKETEEYEWIASDLAVENGSLDGSFYTGERNPMTKLSYKIVETLRVDDTGRGDFKIENSGKNTCLMKVKMTLGGETIYETGYIKPNQHIRTDTLDLVPEPGEYSVEVSFEGFDPATEQSIGATKITKTLVVSE